MELQGQDTLRFFLCHSQTSQTIKQKLPDFEIEHEIENEQSTKESTTETPTIQLLTALTSHH